METLLSDLKTWHAAQCDGDWEHCFGIKIETLDNPGWSLTVELEDTILEDKPFIPVKKEESETSWIECFVESKKFTGYAAPHQLEELISTFLARDKTEPDWLAVVYETEQQRKEREDKELWDALGEATTTTAALVTLLAQTRIAVADHGAARAGGSRTPKMSAYS